MLVFEPNSCHLRGVLIFYLHLLEIAAEARRMLSSTYDEAAPSERMCREWFQYFKSGDSDMHDLHVDGQTEYSRCIWWDQLGVVYEVCPESIGPTFIFPRWR